MTITLDSLTNPSDNQSITTARPAILELVRPNLSDREIEVLREWLMSDSKSSVAQRLFISTGTVNTHLSRIRDKYVLAERPASTKCELLVRAIQDRIVAIEEL
jgi:DNA-binding CsgD family transcriptional regulator